MKTPCIGCRRLIPVGTGGRCSRCRSPQRRYRSSAAWQRRRASVAAGICARCGQAGPVDVHHDRQLAADLAAGIAGRLTPLCGPCHDRAHGWAPRDRS